MNVAYEVIDAHHQLIITAFKHLDYSTANTNSIDLLFVRKKKDVWLECYKEKGYNIPAM